jgi:hypothetical protein
MKLIYFDRATFSERLDGWNGEERKNKKEEKWKSVQHSCRPRHTVYISILKKKKKKMSLLRYFYTVLFDRF